MAAVEVIVRQHFLVHFRLILSATLISQLIVPPTVYPSPKLAKQMAVVCTALPVRLKPQSSNLKILGPDGKTNPVVNEDRSLQLTVVDAVGQPVSGVSFESGSPDIAMVNSETGMVSGKKRGYSTVTARRGGESVSVFVTVTRVSSTNGLKVPGEITQDTGSRIYFSDPIGSVIQRKDSFEAEAKIFAGMKGVNGRKDTKRTEALFAGPTAITLDNRTQGGVYVTDTLNHCIRKIDFQDNVTTAVGKGEPGINRNDVTPFENTFFNGPRGVAADAAGNLFIADTDNHAIYFADFTNGMVRLIAGEPGMSGKADGKGHVARFFRPSGIAISSDKRSIAVADTGNNRVRLIDPSGGVTTIGSVAGAAGIFSTNLSTIDQVANEIIFNNPQSVSFDGADNLIVVDRSDRQVQVVTGVFGDKTQIVSLAQTGTFGEAVSVVVRGTQTFVLDKNAVSEAEAVKAVTIGEPEITSLSLDSDRLEGGAEVIITGKNFGPESMVVLGDSPGNDVRVLSATEIRFSVPQQTVPGSRTLSVQTRGGVDQRAFAIISKPFEELSNGDITTIAGGIPFLGDGGIATRASLFKPGNITIDGSGNLIITDPLNGRIRRVEADTGIITTMAGNGTRNFGGDNVQAVSASLSVPKGVALDGSGNLIIADTGNNRIRRVDANTGIITTVAGNGERKFSGDGGEAISASLAEPTSVSVDLAGNLLIVDAGNSRIRRVDSKTKIITTLAGNGKFDFSGDGSPATSASLNLGFQSFFGFIAGGDVAVDKVGNLIIADFNNHRIRHVDAITGIITTIVGSGKAGFSGDDGQAIRADLNLPTGVALNGSGDLIIADTQNNRIRRVNSSGIINTIAGNGRATFSGDGDQATNAGLGFPEDVAIDGTGNMLISDSLNNRIRLVDAAKGTITTLAGNGTKSFDGDRGSAISAGLSFPESVAVDRLGNLFIADGGNDRIRRVDASGVIDTFAGDGLQDGFGRGSFGGDGGPATSAGLSLPTSVVLDSAGNLFIADKENNRIRRVDASGNIDTVAGNGTAGFSGDGGPATSAALNIGFSTGVAVDREGNLLIGDTNNNRVRRVNRMTGIITTVAGNGTARFSGDGGQALNAGMSPGEIAVDRAGNLFIMDVSNIRIRRVDAKTGTITTVAGNGDDSLDDDDGPATRISIGFPESIAVDGADNLFIATFNIIRRVDAGTGIITTVVGTGRFNYSGDGAPAIEASLRNPDGIAIDEAGNLFIADTSNNAIRVVKGVAAGRGEQPRVAITGASFIKPNLIINGNGFGSTGAIVNVNGRDLGSLIISQADSAIVLKGNKKKLNLKKGQNQITVTANGITSNAFVLQL
jgi:sugar lactone lactonase YvrE